MFTWKPIYGEIAARLKEYQADSSPLVEMMAEMRQQGLKSSPCMDRDDSGNQFQLEEIDPFSFLANFNRPVTTANRQAVLEFLRERWDLQSPVPEDFAGLPVVDLRKSWFMPFKFRRSSEHVTTLWNFYLHCHGAERVDELDTDAFDACTALRNVGLTYLTMGMFWTRPDLWVSLDWKNIDHAKNLGVEMGRPNNGAEYLQWLKAVHERLDIPVWQFSHQSHLESQAEDVDEDDGDEEDSGQSTSLAEPYCRLFDNVEQANEILDIFARVLKEVRTGEDDPLAIVSLKNRGLTGAVLRIIYAKWAVFSYRRRPNDTSFQILLPEGHPAVSNLTRQRRFTRRKTEKAFILGWVDDRWFFENIESLWDDLADVLRTVRTLFRNWRSSPYLPGHVQETCELIVNADQREKGLQTPIELPPDEPSDIAYWLLAPGEGARFWSEFYDLGIGTIGWDDVGDLTNYEAKQELIEAMPEVYPDSGPKSVAAMLWNFAHVVKPGDVVFAKLGLSKVCGWGVVAGEYQFDDSRDLHKHILPVRWHSREEVEVPADMQLSRTTLTPVSRKRRFLDAMADAYSGIPGLNGEPPQPPVDPPPPKPYTKEDALTDLFMPEAQLDRILQQLRRKKNIVLQGAPGTGKTFVARRIAYLLMGERDDRRAPMVQFHQSTAYEDFIQGYRPDGQGGFALKNGGFYEFCEQARRQPGKNFVYIIDEINRGNLSKVFGELLMLIEHDKRDASFAVPLTYASNLRQTFYIPPNLYLIGTMNTADRSLSMVDYALRRRFAFIDLEPGFESETFTAFLSNRGATAEVITAIRARMKKLNDMICENTAGLGRGYRIGHSFFVPASDYAADEHWMNEVIECEVIPLLEEYWCDDESQLERAREIARGTA